MKSICKATRFLAVAGLAALLFASSAQATPIISVSPSTQNSTVGSTVTADIIVSGLTTESIGAVSFLLSFDHSILSGTGYTVDPDNVMGVALDPGFNDLSHGFTSGGGSPLDVFYLADLSFPNNASLLASEGSGFRLATVNFLAVGAGLSPLNLAISPRTGVFFSNFDGTAPLVTTSANGDVCVGAAAGVPANCSTAAVPEPATFGLLATGVAALVRRRRNRKA